MKSPCWCIRQHVVPYWKSIIVILTPILLLPLPMNGTQEAKVGYIMIIMATYWMADALPLAVTGLVPVVAFPLLGIMDTAQICATYFNETNMMVLGSLIVGLCVEHSNLHMRIALRVVLWVGTDPKMLMLGVMLVTMFLSMWVDNTATTTMILPMVDVLVRELFRDDEDGGSDEALTVTAGDVESKRNGWDETQPQRQRRLRVYLFLAVCFAANIGGNGTLIGNTPTLVLKGISDDLFGSDSTVSFTAYMAIGVPIMIINVFVLWAMFQVSLFGFRCQRKPEEAVGDQRMKAVVLHKYRELGAMSWHETAVFVLFVVLINLWVWRDPKFVPGWGSLFSKKVGDSVPVIVISLLLFILPVRPNFWCWRSAAVGEKPKTNESLIDWSIVQNKVPWGLFLLIGGGIACAEAAKVSGLSKLMGEQLGVLETLPKFVIMLIICTFIGVLTEAVSNAAMSNIFLPVLAQTAVTIQVSPMYLMIPAATVCNYPFVLPVGAMSNAIAFERAKWKLSDTLKLGLLFKLVNTLVVCVVMETLGQVIISNLPTPVPVGTNLTSPATT